MRHTMNRMTAFLLLLLLLSVCLNALADTGEPYTTTDVPEELADDFQPGDILLSEDIISAQQFHRGLIVVFGKSPENWTRPGNISDEEWSEMLEYYPNPGYEYDEDTGLAGYGLLNADYRQVQPFQYTYMCSSAGRAYFCTWPDVEAAMLTPDGEVLAKSNTWSYVAWDQTPEATRLCTSDYTDDAHAHWLSASDGNFIDVWNTYGAEGYEDYKRKATGVGEGLIVSIGVVCGEEEEQPDSFTEHIQISNTAGQILATCEEDTVTSIDREVFHEGMCMVQETWDAAEDYSRRIGFINTAGELVIPAVYVAAREFHEGYAAVCLAYGEEETDGSDEWQYGEDGTYYKWGPEDEWSGEWNFVDKQGHLLTEENWEQIGSFSEGLAPVRKAGKWGFIDLKGSLVIDCTWDDLIFSFRDGRAIVAKDGESHLIDTEGRLADGDSQEWLNAGLYQQIVVDNAYTQIFYWRYAEFGGWESKRYNSDLEYDVSAVLPTDYYTDLMEDGGDIDPQTGEGYEAIGMMNRQGELIAPCNYQSAQIYDKVVILRDENGVYGAIDHQGNIIAPFLYDNIYYGEGKLTLNRNNRVIIREVKE